MAGTGRDRPSAAEAAEAPEATGGAGTAGRRRATERRPAPGEPDGRAPGKRGSAGQRPDTSAKQGPDKGAGEPDSAAGKPATAPDGAGEAADGGEEPAAGERGPRPPRVAVAAVLSGVEGLVIAAFGCYELVLGVFGEPDSTRQAVFGGLTVLGLAALPLAAAAGLWRQRRWSRGPSMITQILALPVAWAMSSAGGVMLPLGLLLGAVALVALVCVLSPSTAEALGVGPSRTA
ncbi:hypothetical protein GCM10009802_21000 [Streptomyces synnematoformans]|uniref:Integral membrane protein n=1 Tax=Streptomyces synnematoformans TaxID=415721 RepID=A0ABN2XXD8_9ACTN